MKKLDKSLMDANKLQNIAQDILQEAKREGADQAELSITANKGFSVSAHNKDVETIEYNQDKLIELTVYIGKRSGSASISDIRKEAIQDAIHAACHIAKFTDEDQASGLAEVQELASHYPQLQLAYPWKLSVKKAIELACQCEREALAYDKRIMIAEEVSVGTVEALHIYANSNHFLGCYPYTHHEINCVLVAKEGNEMQRDYSYTISPDPTYLDSISTVAKHAAERTVNRLGARSLATQKAPVIFLAEEARGLLSHFAAAINGSSIYRKSSFLLNQLGKQIFSKFVQIKEHPHLLRGLGSTPFDDDGVATRANVFIENGVLCHYALNIYSARKLGMKTTGNAGGMHNLTIEHGSKNLAKLIKTMDKGLLITEMMGQGVNLITGDYSRGVGGFWVENGEIQYPVHEVTVASKLQNIYKNIVEVGNDVDIRGNIRTGSILIEEMMIAGN